MEEEMQNSRSKILIMCGVHLVVTIGGLLKWHFHWANGTQTLFGGHDATLITRSTFIEEVFLFACALYQIIASLQIHGTWKVRTFGGLLALPVHWAYWTKKLFCAYAFIVAFPLACALYLIVASLLIYGVWKEEPRLMSPFCFLSDFTTGILVVFVSINYRNDCLSYNVDLPSILVAIVSMYCAKIVRSYQQQVSAFQLVLAEIAVSGILMLAWLDRLTKF